MPELVIMDIRLAGAMDGVTASDMVRKHYGLPVILLTGHADDETLDRAKVTEPFAYLIKPFEARELRTAVAIALYRNRMDREVRHREELLSKILEAIASGVIVHDGRGLVTYTNSHVAGILGAEVPNGEHIERVLPSEIKEQAGESTGPIEWEPAEGKNRVIKVLILPLANGDGDASDGSCAYVLTDVTAERDTDRALRKMDAQLAHAQRMEAVGRTAGALAHDFNNLVTVIMGYTRLALDDLSDLSELRHVRENVEGVYQTARRSSVLTRRLLGFSRSEPSSPELVAPDQFIERNREIFQGLMPESVAVQLMPRASTARIYIDPTRFEQIVLNLALNARDAMPGGGRIILSTEIIDTEAPLPGFSHSAPAGRYLLLRVADTGKGIDPADLPYVFDPYFTTKQTADGSGFGLATVYAAARESGGVVDVTSTVGQGTTFTVYLPHAQANQDVAPLTDPLIERVSGSESVLVVQEEEAVRTLVGSVLRSRGFHPTVVRSVGDALLVLERSDPFAAIVTDRSAPYLSPAEIVRRLRRASGGAAIVFVGLSESMEAAGAHVLVKPFEPHELSRAVRDAIDSA
jgi:signal transduction histidine kinase/DNA-binding response OmpR family regulator